METNTETPGISVRIVGDCAVHVWGLSSPERLRRQVAAAGVSDIAPATQPPGPGRSSLLLRADHLFEQRTINDLVGRQQLVLRCGETPVAAHVTGAQFAETKAYLEGARATPPTGVAETTATSLSTAFNPVLRKSQPPMVLPIRADNRAAIERYLFDGAYKGITDVVTKWVWPAPARAVVRLCAHAGIPPNVVTGSSVALVVVATWLFWRGDFALGLLLGWIMTFFDTVDGKLARVTVQATRIGHALDKGTDLIHPPIWYIAWGYGLAAHGGPAGNSLWDVYAVILVGYIVGRLIEGAFNVLLGRFALYTWTPMDAWVRLIIARRNPNLILLSGSLLVGRPDVGLYAVAAWTALSSVYLALRLLHGIILRLTRGPIESWLKYVDSDGGENGLSARIFARRTLPPSLDAG